MKRLLSVLLALLMLSGVFVSAADSQESTASALYSLQLFLGYGNDKDGNPVFGLGDPLDRQQATLLMLRMLGLADEAAAYQGAYPFSDACVNYFKPYIAYAYDKGLIKGTSATTFEGTLTMNSQMFSTICLRALGYQDGKGGDFAFRDAIFFAQEKGLTQAGSGGAFTRGSAVLLFWQTLMTARKDAVQTLAEKLCADGVFTAQALSNAKTIQKGNTTPAIVISVSGGGSGGRQENTETGKTDNSSAQTQREMGELDDDEII